MDLLTNIVFAWHERKRKPKGHRKIERAKLIAALIAMPLPEFLIINIVMYTLGIIFLFLMPSLGLGFIGVSLYFTIKAATYR